MSEPDFCVGYLTKGILDNAHDLVDAWREKPYRRDEFEGLALEQIEEAKNLLAGLEQYVLIHKNRKYLKELRNAVAS